MPWQGAGLGSGERTAAVECRGDVYALSKYHFDGYEYPDATREVVYP